MCDPVTLTALTVASTVVTAGGQMYAADATAKGERFKAKVEDRNARMDQAAAKDALERGQIEERNQYRRNAQRLGAQRATLAANGVEVDFGSAADLQDDARMIGWEDAQTVRENTMQEVKGFEISAWNRKAGAANSRANAKAAMVKGMFDAGGTILSGATQVGKTWAGPSPGNSFSPGGGGSSWRRASTPPGFPA